MKTIEIIMDEVAKENGFESWFHVLSKRLFRLEDINKIIVEVCKRYAIEVNNNEWTLSREMYSSR